MRGRVRLMRAICATWGLLTLRMVSRRARLLLFLLAVAKLLDVLSHGGLW
jgi:hypothetical protein